jgi:hypothetical protein
MEQLKEGAPETEKDYIDFFEDLRTRALWNC